ncbi:hypothetical protein TCAL_01188 [Tigriopus californicus]|uniref:pyridoxal 5'-phosphate synthase n=2 Tax=Tigriopus californicus TaxID=6832 RepID=A0A553NZ64_TIGCA|nr:hypothetical protein TCAL_01188 [Tigriopus californicus]|eukprot:TCALIF_01188-PA protein Name:"Similar to PNPO Pyridoxine-5'-phosphate oxidase (Homo sapiens)" AED:0.02 eAED:0.02 QI:0/-1/0/1/-1/1/1/0/233
MSIDIGGMRKPYLDQSATFDTTDLVAQEPWGQFQAWFDQAKACSAIEEANAMCLATASKSGVPSARMVLLKAFGPEGFVFYTNYESRKAKDLSENPQAALTFYWEPLKRSIRVEGSVAKVSEATSTEYFRTRPLGSQIGAAVSHQSRVIAGRQELENREAQLKAEFGDGSKVLDKPEAWGGFLVTPVSMEFWQGQSTRLHDRIRFRRPAPDEKPDPSITHIGTDGWVYERLAP